MITIDQAVDWVLEHRRGKAFEKYNSQQIEWAISRAINCKGFAFAQLESGKLIGIICATPNTVEKTLRVHEVLCIDPRALPSMAMAFMQRFHGYAITAKRRGRERTYRTNRLVQLLSNYEHV